MLSVSVAMATYNGASFIRQQLDSIAAQAVRPNELVVTDDGSSDETVSIVRNFADTAPFPVRIYENSCRLGYRANFMHNISLCKFDLVAFCDQDDVWESNKIERLISFFSDPEIVLCYHESWMMTADGEQTGLASICRLPAVNPPLSFHPLRNPYGFSIIFRRSLLVFSDLWEESVDNLQISNRMAHDQWIFFLASVFGTIIFVDEPLASYRQHDSNTYGVRSRNPEFPSMDWIIHTAEELSSFTEAARARKLILRKAQDRLTGNWLQRARTAADRYGELERDCAMRSTIYVGNNLFRRLSAWLEAVRAGVCYKKAGWTVGRRAAVKDLLSAFVPRGLVFRRGHEPVEDQLHRHQDFRSTLAGSKK